MSPFQRTHSRLYLPWTARPWIRGSLGPGVLEDRGGKPVLKDLPVSVGTHSFLFFQGGRAWRSLVCPTALDRRLPSTLVLSLLGRYSGNRRGILSPGHVASRAVRSCGHACSCPPPAFRGLERRRQHWPRSRGGDECPTRLRSLTVSHVGTTPVEAGS